MNNKVFVLYENADWLPALKDTFSQEGLSFEPWFVDESTIDIDQEPPQGIYLNRLSASAATRQHEYSLLSGQRVIEWLEAWGRTVINGSSAIALEQSKFKQHLLMKKHNIKTPASIFIAGEEKQLKLAQQKIPFPLIYKYDCGGKGLGVKLIQNQDQWQDFLDQKSWQEAPGLRHVLQSYIKPKEPFITRCEFIGGKLHYAIKADTSQGFELCPAEACRIDICQTDAKSQSLFTIRNELNPSLIQSYEAMLNDARISIAGVEFIESVDNETYTYDINCNTNYSPAIEEDESVEPGLKRVANFLKESMDKGQLT